MAKHPHQSVIPFPLSVTGQRPVMKLKVAVAGTLQKLLIKSDVNNTSGADIVFDVKLDGVTIYAAPGDRPVIANGANSVSQVLSIVVAEFQTAEVVLVTALPSSAPIGNSLYIQIIVEDGLLASARYDSDLALSDESTVLSVGVKAIIHAKTGFTLSSLMLGLSTASTSGIVTVNIKKNNTSLFATKITIDATEATSLTAVTAYVLTGTISFIAGDEIKVEVDTAGTGAKGLKLYMTGVI